MSYENAFICTEGSSNTAMFQHNTTSVNSLSCTVQWHV